MGRQRAPLQELGAWPLRRGFLWQIAVVRAPMASTGIALPGAAAATRLAFTPSSRTTTSATAEKRQGLAQQVPRRFLGGGGSTRRRSSWTAAPSPRKSSPGLLKTQRSAAGSATARLGATPSQSLNGSADCSMYSSLSNGTAACTQESHPLAPGRAMAAQTTRQHI